MDSEAIELLAELEYALCAKLRPTFLVLSPPNEFKEIHVIISTLAFKHMTIQERTNNTFSLIKQYSPVILDKYLLVIQTYSSDEMDEVLEDIFTKELK
jgi:hypothetical protein